MPNTFPAVNPEIHHLFQGFEVHFFPPFFFGLDGGGSCLTGIGCASGRPAFGRESTVIPVDPYVLRIGLSVGGCHRNCFMGGRVPRALPWADGLQPLGLTWSREHRVCITTVSCLRTRGPGRSTAPKAQGLYSPGQRPGSSAETNHLRPEGAKPGLHAMPRPTTPGFVWSHAFALFQSHTYRSS